MRILDTYRQRYIEHVHCTIMYMGGAEFSLGAGSYRAFVGSSTQSSVLDMVECRLRMFRFR